MCAHMWPIWSVECRMGSPGGEYKALLTLIHNTRPGRGQCLGKCEHLNEGHSPHLDCQAVTETLAQYSNSVVVVATSAADDHSD